MLFDWDEWVDRLGEKQNNEGTSQALVHRSFVNGLAIGRQDRNQLDPSAMPFKHNADRRHHIGKMKFRVTNWRDYEAGLRRRGSLTLWVAPEALAGWRAPRRKTRGGQARYSDLAIETALTLGCVFAIAAARDRGIAPLAAGSHGAESPSSRSYDAEPSGTEVGAISPTKPAAAGRPAACACR